MSEGENGRMSRLAEVGIRVGPPWGPFFLVLFPNFQYIEGYVTASYRLYCQFQHP